MNNVDLSLLKSNIFLLVNYKLIIGTILYITSFLSWFVILSRNELSFIYPIIVGLGYICIILLSILFLKESITLYKMLGITLILIGVIIISLKGK
ncbi:MULTISPECIES: DMT family transporter [unclassified Paenibacillus]|uniref:DMT family transporter n=1 Tax=unclassified Paenibacillus TaxID=185978 RepID=UPI0036393446